MGGLITVFRRDLDYTVHDYISLGDPHDPEEPKALLVHCSVWGIEMVIANVYITPCSVQKKREDFLNKVTDTWTEFGCPNIICCGDFNSVMDPSIDAIDADPKATPIHTSCVLHSFAEESELVDVYRVHNPITRRVTHIRGSYNTGKHLDYILLAGYFLNMVEEAEVLPKMFSDHNAISVMLQFNRNPEGKGYWKFQDALLANENYLNFIKQQIKQTVEVNKNSTTPEVLWDTVKCSIRESTCRFLKADKNNDKIKYESFQAELAELHHLRDGSYHPKVRERYNDRIVQVTKDWESFSQTLQKKALDFSIGRKRQQDEKSSKYFFRKYNAIPGSSTMMFNTEGEACTTDSCRLNAVVRTLRYSHKSLLGHILLVKTMLASKFVYLFSLLLSPHYFILNKLD